LKYIITQRRGGCSEVVATFHRLVFGFSERRSDQKQCNAQDLYKKYKKIAMIKIRYMIGLLTKTGR